MFVVLEYCRERKLQISNFCPAGGAAEELAIKDREIDLPSKPAQSGVIFHHAIMNLPASAVEFLDAFQGSFNTKLWHGQKLPLVHVYTFARSCDTDEGKSAQIRI